MEVIDPGHVYILKCLDTPGVEKAVVLTFVKREGEGYPGNVGHYPGTTTQEVLRALIDRIKYVDNQIRDQRNDSVLTHLRMAIFQLEMRAAERHGRVLSSVNFSSIEELPVCIKCGHIGCKGECRD